MLADLILIVEDDDTTLKLLRDIMQVNGYRVIEATDGREAIERAIKEKPDLITMDLQLPVLDGLDATRAIKENPATRNIPIIALTASAMKGQDQKALKAGCDAYIDKPFNIETLFKKVKEYLSKIQV
jgi:two-component system, cell cycle response regulator DivK